MTRKIANRLKLLVVVVALLIAPFIGIAMAKLFS